MEPLATPATDIPYFHEAMILLVSSVVAVAALHRLRASPVLGYLVAGLAIGPSGLAIIGNVEAVRTFAELGVVLLLFLVGLELSFERLKALRRMVFGLGGLQVVLSTAAIAVAAYALGLGGAAAVVIGGALALSSTAVVLQILIERGEVASPLGRVSFAILLLQDLAVVPLLVMVTVLGGDPDEIGPALGLAGLKALIAVAAILVVGRYALRLPFRWVAATRSAELFMALALLVILATGWLTHAAGLSMALGAFLAGLLLAETEYRHQVETDIRPFKGLLIGLFFMAVGMSIDAHVVTRHALTLVGAVAGLIVLKAAIVAALCLVFGQARDVALRAGLLLGPGGEFAFVLGTAAVASGALDGETGQLLIAVTGLSILFTPLLAAAGSLLAGRLAAIEADKGLSATLAESESLGGHVVIAGFGRVGQTIATLLGEQKVPYVAIDYDARLVTQWRRQKMPVYFGDASREDVLAHLGADRAAALIVTLDNPEAARRTLANVRRRWPELKTFVRAHDATHLAELRELGASGVVPETLESSLRLARYALDALGTPAEAAERLVAEVRAAGYAEAEESDSATPPERP